MIGSVLNSLNTRLDAAAIAFMLQHGEAKVLITDREFSGVVGKALHMLERRPLVIDIDDPLAAGGDLLGEMTYEAFLGTGDPEFAWALPADEWDAIALNYTSGTTGNPKGVVLHHRGAYLNAVSNVVTWNMPHFPVYLWTLPMFHCNGWCFPWTVAMQAGTNVCLRRVEAAAVFELIREQRVTHFCGAPVVHNMLINAPDSLRAGIDHTVHGMIAGAAPPQAVIEGMERMGFNLTHVYGLTEVYGPAAVCAKHPEWDALSLEQRAERNGRQGVPYELQEDMIVADPQTLRPVPWDGADDGRDLLPRQHHHEGLSQEPQGDAGGVHGRLVSHRRSGGGVPGRLRQDQGPVQGHHHLRRREYLHAGGGGRAVSPSRRAGGGRGGAAGREVG